MKFQLAGQTISKTDHNFNFEEMEDFVVIEFWGNEDSLFLPTPFIPDKTIVILLQDRTVKIAKYHEPNKEESTLSFSHPNDEIPKNREIRKIVTDIIKTKYPAYLDPEVALILTCPEYLAEQLIW